MTAAPFEKGAAAFFRFDFLNYLMNLLFGCFQKFQMPLSFLLNHDFISKETRKMTCFLIFKNNRSDQPLCQ